MASQHCRGMVFDLCAKGSPDTDMSSSAVLYLQVDQRVVGHEDAFGSNLSTAR